MALTNAFRDYVATLVVGAGGTAFNNANAYIGVGDSTTAHAFTQTDLQGTTNRLRKAMDATYPTNAANVLTFRSTFGTAEANWAWQEWGVFNNPTTGSGTMMNRKVESLGTKTSAQSWQITVTITLAVA